ncbi:MAG TPA: DUF1453 domain-containing protein [Verrucomicrobiae bacterium]
MTSAPIMPLLLGGFIVWNIYRRVRRNIGRQKLRPRRITYSIIIFSIFTIFIIVASAQNPRLLLGFGGGFLPGLILALIGLRLTKFETTNEGHFYTPNTHIGVALSLLLTGRIVYRYLILSHETVATKYPAPFQSPLTLLIIGLTFGYYITYYLGLFAHTRDKN